MENYCQGCTSAHQPLMNTWNKKGSLQPSNYNPFKSWSREGYCGGNNNATSSAWTRAGNVTPDNSSIYHTHILKMTPFKENFCCGKHNTYPRMSQTWNKQKSYTSN